MDPLQSAVTQKRDFLQPIFPLLFLISTTFSITSAIAYMVVSMFERVFFRFVSDTILFRVLSEGVLSKVFFRVLSDRVLFRVVNERAVFRVVCDRVLFMVFSDRALFRFFRDMVLSKASLGSSLIGSS